MIEKIKLLILDCDGVLTDGKIYYSHTGEEMISFNVQDGHGIVHLQANGIPVAVISGRENTAVAHRLKQLKIEHVFLGQHHKLPAFDSLLQIYKITPNQVAYVGDDLPDLDVIKKVGLPIAVANAIDSIKKIAKITTQKKGGDGAVREVCDLIYSAQQIIYETQ